MTGEDGAPILLIRSAECVLIPAKTAHGIKVAVPMNPAAIINIQPVDDGSLDGAVSGIYRHKNRQNDKYLNILYCNLSENCIVFGEVIAHGSMCLVEKTPKDVVINAVKPGIKSKTVTDKLWADLKLKNNEILKQVPEISENLYTMLNDYQDVFTNDTCQVGKTSWETFKIELLPNARPVNQRVRPLAPPPLREKIEKTISGLAS